ncbi:MAG: two-component system response regulator CreB, partial [Verrucomicrobiota bacterium]
LAAFAAQPHDLLILDIGLPDMTGLDVCRQLRQTSAVPVLFLTAREYKLLLVLLERPARVFTRDQLLDQAWQDPGAVTDRTIDAHIKSIRAKLRTAHPGAEDLIQTRRRLDYSLVIG